MNTNIARTFARYIALPVVSAGVIGGAALGLAGMANAATVTTETSTGSAIVSSPDTYAKPAPSALPGWRHHHGARPPRHVQPVSPQLNSSTLQQRPSPAAVNSGEGLPRARISTERTSSTAHASSQCRSAAAVIECTYRRAHGNRTARRAPSPQAWWRGRGRGGRGRRRRRIRCRAVALAARRRHR